MKIVSNASPLINLSRIGKVDLLHGLFRKLVILGLYGVRSLWKGRGFQGQR